MPRTSVIVEEKAEELTQEAATDEMSAWTWRAATDREIPELVKLKNEFEISEGIQMSKDGIVNFIEEMVSKEHPNSSGDWHTRMDGQQVKMATREGGSKHNGSTFFRVDAEYDKTWKLENLVSVMYDEKHVPEWNPMISHNEF